MVELGENITHNTEEDMVITNDLPKTSHVALTADPLSNPHKPAWMAIGTAVISGGAGGRRRGAGGR